MRPALFVVAVRPVAKVGRGATIAMVVCVVLFKTLTLRGRVIVARIRRMLKLRLCRRLLLIQALQQFAQRSRICEEYSHGVLNRCGRLVHQCRTVAHGVAWHR